MAAALLILIGGSIAFASGALTPSGTGEPASTSAPPPAPALVAPTDTITQADTIDLVVLRPDGLSRAEHYVVRVYVNDQMARERALPTTDQFDMPAVPLVEGENSIRAALVGDGGMGPYSAPISIMRDDIEPVIRVFRPQPNSTVYIADEVLRGRTEPGASLTATDLATTEVLETAVQPDGRFETALSLALGQNTLLLHSQDAAGNEASARINLTRADSLASLTLSVSNSDLRLQDLPLHLEAVAWVLDERGHPVDGVEVVFSISPPNTATMTYRTDAAAGRASWAGIEINGGTDAQGNWLVTALAVLPSGTELRDDESIIVR